MIFRGLVEMSKMVRRSFRPMQAGLAACLIATSALALSACREEEQGKFSIEQLEKGTYQGEPDTPLKEETLEELRFRVRNQSA